MEKSILEKCIADKMTYRQIADKLGVSVPTIQYWLNRVYHLTTVRGRFKPIPYKPKNVAVIDNTETKAFHIDITEISTQLARPKHKRVTENSIFTVEFDKAKFAFIYNRKAIHNKTLISNIMLQLKNLYDSNIILSDKEFTYLTDVGFKVYKTAKWNCSKQTNEKHYGNLKRWVYPLIKYDKEKLNLTDEDLLENSKIILENYLIQLKNNGYTVIDKTNTTDAIENQSPLPIVS